MMTRKRLWALALISVAGFPGAILPQARSGNPQLLIETPDLEAALSDSTLRLLDARPLGQYQQGHISGAINLPAPATDSLEANREGLPITIDRAQELFRQAGVNTGSRIVVYDDQGNRFAARVFYVLEAFGHRQVQVLNGGISKWTSEGRPLSAEVPTVPAGDFKPKPDSARIVTSSWVLGRLKDPTVALVDARSPAEFSGVEVQGPRGGHIPGAVNIEWRQVIDSGPVKKFLDAPRLEKLFHDAGITPEKKVIPYCQIGMRAADIYFALRLLGYDVQMYDGSWEDWSADSALPIEE
jgi:thiosulfate/3-mercaptopyruvate sulfurtransferase